MTAETILKTVGSGAVGLVLGWAGHSLTMQGRVQALEVGQTAILVRLDALLQAKGVEAPPVPVATR